MRPIVVDAMELTTMEVSILAMLQRNPAVFAIALMTVVEGKEDFHENSNHKYTTGHRQCHNTYENFRPKKLYASHIFDEMLVEAKTFAASHFREKAEWAFQVFLDDHDNAIIQYQWDGRHGITVKGITFTVPKPVVTLGKRLADDRYPSYDEYLKRFKAYHCQTDPEDKPAEAPATIKERMMALYEKWHEDEKVEKMISVMLSPPDSVSLDGISAITYVPFTQKAKVGDKENMCILFCVVYRLVMDLGYAMDLFAGFDNKHRSESIHDKFFQARIIVENPTLYVPKQNYNTCFLPNLTNEEKETKFLCVFKLFEQHAVFA
jgi:hypothetical protein